MSEQDRHQWVPSVQDLYQVSGERANKLLLARITERYVEGRAAYSGRVIGADPPYVLNRCVSKDTLQDIEEELVDAAFNMLVLAWKWQMAPDIRDEVLELQALYRAIEDVWLGVDLARKRAAQQVTAQVQEAIK